MARKPQQPGDAATSREDLWFALRRDVDGLRGLQQYLDEIKDVDDAQFAQATGGTDRAEAMALLEHLNKLLGEVDKLTAQLHGDVN